MINKNLVLLSYGRNSEYLRAIFCILSFSSWHEHQLNEIRINVYTDDPDFFKPYLSHLNIEYISLTPALMKDLLGNTDYFHRRKVGVIDMTFQRFPAEDVIFIDSDTFFITGTHQLFATYTPGQSYMHRLEYTLADGLEFFTAFNQQEHPKAFIDYIAGREFQIDGQTVIFTKEDYCWNSGVLGLSHTFAKYMPDVFRLTDAFYANSKWFISEQLAFGLIIQRVSKIQPAEKFVVHYWGKRQKSLFDRLLSELFDKSSVKQIQDPAFLKETTISWNKEYEIDLIMEQAVIALTHNDWKTGVKKSIQAILKSPFNQTIYKELYTAIKPV